MKRTRGERAGLTRELVLDAAIDLVDRSGLAALTMRQLAAELGVEAMTLYHHVPNKNALIDGIVERVFAAAAPAQQDGEQWIVHMRRYAEALREGLLRHPGVLPVIIRPAATPATMDAVEQALRILTDAGFPLGRAVDSLNALTLFVIGHTAAEAAIGPGAEPPELDPRRHPLVTMAAQSGAGADDYERFRYAVDAMLTGFVPGPV